MDENNKTFVLKRGPCTGRESVKSVSLTKGDNVNDTDESSDGNNAGNAETASSSS